jgi:hypothetical protein
MFTLLPLVKRNWKCNYSASSHLTSSEIYRAVFPMFKIHLTPKLPYRIKINKQFGYCVPIPGLYLRKRVKTGTCMICLGECTSGTWCCGANVHMKCLKIWLTDYNGKCPQKCGKKIKVTLKEVLRRKL